MGRSSITTIFGTLIQTGDGSWTIKHAEHGQDFHSSEGAKFEAWELYVVASGLRESLRQKACGPVTVLDVGMGLGYNACATIAAWLNEEDPADLQLQSLEIDSRLVSALADGTAPWLENWEESWLAGPKALKTSNDSTWRSVCLHRNQKSKLEWLIAVGDASATKIPMFAKKFQFIWQDPFTPELNPKMWSSSWFRVLRDVASDDVQLMTYSVARIVKDALAESGWTVTRFRTPGQKRHWLKAHL